MGEKEQKLAQLSGQDNSELDTEEEGLLFRNPECYKKPDNLTIRTV